MIWIQCISVIFCCEWEKINHQNAKKSNMIFNVIFLRLLMRCTIDSGALGLQLSAVKIISPECVLLPALSSWEHEKLHHFCLFRDFLGTVRRFCLRGFKAKLRFTLLTICRVPSEIPSSWETYASALNMWSTLIKLTKCGNSQYSSASYFLHPTE